MFCGVNGGTGEGWGDGEMGRWEVGEVWERCGRSAGEGES
jgi:hypothetical protein